MAAVQTASERALNKVAIIAVLVVTLVFLAPIYESNTNRDFS